MAGGSGRLRRTASVLVALAALTLAGCGQEDASDGQIAPGATDAGSAGAGPGLSQDANPFIGRDLYVWPGSAAAAAAASETDPERAALLQQIADVPTAVWLTPEAHGLGAVGPFVDTLVADAVAVAQVPVVVIYGVPSRDCGGGFSSGGLPEADYLSWVTEIRDAAGTDAVAILEPDALAAARECGLVAERRRILSQAVALLADGGPVTYVDAGHSGWQDPGVMAQELSKIGVREVRGFAVNVAGYGTDADESAYGQQIANILGGSAFVIDTSRNGSGATGDFCNPAGRSLGQRPAAAAEGLDLDARLWIKPPGESDGTCAGGPPAGTFWADRAIELARNAGYTSG